MNLKIILQKSSNELEKAGIPTASLDARVLLEEVLKKDTSAIFSHPEMPPTNTQYARFRSLIRRRKKGEPVAYLAGHKEFYGYDFFVNKNVLIPRPETELLVENVIEYIKSHCDKSTKKQSDVHVIPSEVEESNNRLPRLSLRSMARNDRINIIDIGTGSGCIIISILLSLQANFYKLQPKFYASDISRKALYVARKNAKLHQVNKEIKFYNSDLFANKKMPKRYDMIIANLPYVPTSYKLQAKSLHYEPESAIFADDNGTKIIKKFLDQARDRINKNGLILIEIDPRNAKELMKYTKEIFTKSKIELLKDLANLDRVIKILN